jgi:5-methylcytosine-specific restriction endonuclease McrA
VIYWNFVMLMQSCGQQMRSYVERKNVMRRNVKNLGSWHQARDELSRMKTEESTSY